MMQTQARDLFFHIYLFYLFIQLCWVLVVAHRIFSGGMRTFISGMWDLVPCPRSNLDPLHLEHRPPGKSQEQLAYYP